MLQYDTGNKNYIITITPEFKSVHLLRNSVRMFLFPDEILAFACDLECEAVGYTKILSRLLNYEQKGVFPESR